MLNRRDTLKRAALLSVGIGVTGCTGSETDETTNETDGTEEVTVEDNDTEQEATEPEPEADWQRSLPRCSSGEYSFRVEVVNVEETVIRVENLTSQELKVADVTAVYGRDELESKFVNDEIAGGETIQLQFNGSYKPITDLSVSLHPDEDKTDMGDCWEA